MSSSWIAELFGVDKPIIAMAHFPALPGTPRYDAALGVDGMMERMRRDIDVLLAGGVDAIMFCNEDDRPYSLKADFEAVAVMTRIMTELRPTDRPYGVDFLWDPKAPLAIAKATGASFIREIITGVYESDMGIWQPDAAALYRYRRQIDADDVRIMANMTPEFASPLGSRSVAERVASAVVSTLVDAILISGSMAGAQPDLSAVREAHEAVAGSVPVFVNTGTTADTIGDCLGVSDGAIVGSWLKVDGHTWNPVDPDRVRAYMAAVHEARRA